MQLTSFPEDRLVAICNELKKCESLSALTASTAAAARELTNAEGSSFIIREDDMCYYCDENAISQLWKGKRFPIHSCISGWAMVHKEIVIIDDIYLDGRIPLDLYRPTFVKSLLMIPIGKDDAIAAIGIYWSKRHLPTVQEVKTLQMIADANTEVLKTLM